MFSFSPTLRTEAGNMKLFGGNNPAAVLYLKADFIAKNPETVQRLVMPSTRRLSGWRRPRPRISPRWCRRPTHLGDKPLYLAAVKTSKPMYSKTGMIPDTGMKNAYNMLTQFDKQLAAANIDLSKTFDGSFVKKAASGS